MVANERSIELDSVQTEWWFVVVVFGFVFWILFVLLNYT